MGTPFRGAQFLENPLRPKVVEEIFGERSFRMFSRRNLIFPRKNNVFAPKFESATKISILY